MKNQMYVVFDRAAQESGPIFEAKNDAIALRNYQKFMDGVDVGSKDDFKLLCIGSIEHETQEVEIIAVREVIANLNMEE